MEIEKEENSMALACLEMEPYSPDIRERLEDWKERFFNFKKELISQLNPDLNYVDLIIYGRQVEPIAEHYI